MGNPLFLARVARQAAATEPDPTPERLNERVWSRGSFLRLYSDRTLRPPEVVLLARYRDELSGRVLELGSGGGRNAGYLLELGAEVRGIDLSEAMVEYCRRRYPRGTFDVGDLRDLAGHGDASYDAVFAGYNLLDVLDDPERRRVLGEIRRILIPDGVLIMSSHNRAYLPRVRPATRLPRARDPLRLAADLVRMPRRIYNSRRVRPLERSEERYALANDEAHDYRLLHYYIDRDEQGRQFAEVGFELVECLDGEGAIVAEGETAADSPELHYVAHATR
jgi:SAM-dependent methyltransferase